MDLPAGVREQQREQTHAAAVLEMQARAAVVDRPDVPHRGAGSRRARPPALARGLRRRPRRSAPRCRRLRRASRHRRRLGRARRASRPPRLVSVASCSRIDVRPMRLALGARLRDELRRAVGARPRRRARRARRPPRRRAARSSCGRRCAIAAVRARAKCSSACRRGRATRARIPSHISTGPKNATVGVTMLRPANGASCACSAARPVGEPERRRGLRQRRHRPEPDVVARQRGEVVRRRAGRTPGGPRRCGRRRPATRRARPARRASPGTLSA